jgi:hypothetical protein
VSCSLSFATVTFVPAEKSAAIAKIQKVVLANIISAPGERRGVHAVDAYYMS